MRGFADKQFDLVLTDPPYGIGEHGGKNRHGPKSTAKGFGHSSYENGEWDKNTPSQEYFDEIFRVSKNQIIFGMNYFCLPPTKGFVFWHKKGSDRSDFADGELIWTSYKRAARYFKFDWVGFGYINNSKGQKKQHPTQKPIQLIEALVEEFAPDADSILDPFMGSGTTLVAAKYLNRNATGIEISPKYCEIARKRLAQDSLFVSQEPTAREETTANVTGSLI